MALVSNLNNTLTEIKALFLQLMGCFSSKEKDSEDKAQLTDRELNDISILFNEISRGNQKTELELKWSYVDKRLLSMIDSFYFKHKKVLTLHEFIVPAVHILRRSTFDKAKMITKLASQGAGSVSNVDFIQYVSSVVSTYVNLLDYLGANEFYGCDRILQPKNEKKYDKYAAWLCNSLQTTDHNRIEAHAIDAWLSSVNKFEDMHHSIYHVMYHISPEEVYLEDIFPVLIDEENVFERGTSLLDAISILFLNNFIANSEKHKWTILYSSTVHGASFLSILEHIKDKGPTLLVIKTNENDIFGGYAAESWITEGPARFYGNNTSFLYTLQPEMNVYQSSGNDQNYQYLAFKKKALQNGMGFGGVVGEFGLWIAADGVKGESKGNCPTYSNAPKLSSKQNFSITHMEVWGFGFSKQRRSTMVRRMTQL